MDAEILDAVASVDIDPSQATAWFDLVNGAYSAANDNWDTFSERLSSTAGGTFGVAATQFLQYAGDHGKTELVGKLVADLTDLPSAYASRRTAAAQPVTQPAAASWETVVQQFGPGWAGWDGSEAGWTQFRDWTYTSANTQHPDLYALAYDKLNPLNERPLAERITALAGFGFTITAKQAPSGSLWDTVAAQFGSGWANWDGSEARWIQFRDWTYTSANTLSPDMYAAAYEKLNPLNDVALAERIGKLTELGLAVHAPPDEPAAEIDAAELGKIVDEALAEALKQIPGAEELTSEEVAEIRAEIAAELASEADDE